MSTRNTIVGTGTVGLGQSYATSVHQEVERLGMKEYWSNWEKTRKKWKKLDSDRNQKVAEVLSANAHQKVREASELRMQDIRTMIKDRKRYEIEDADRRKTEEEEQRHLNKSLNAKIRQDREEGIYHRNEIKQRELEEIHHKRNEFLEADRIERKRIVAYIKANHAALHQYYEHCRETVKDGQVRRVECLHVEAKALNKQKRSRKEDVTSWRNDIVRCKATMIKRMREAIYNGLETAKENCRIRAEKNFNEVKEDTERQRTIRKQREHIHREEKYKMVTSFRTERQETRRKYNAAKTQGYVMMQREVKDQRLKARHAAEQECDERHREHQAFIANVRELAHRRRIDRQIYAPKPSMTVSRASDRDDDKVITPGWE